MSYPGVEVRGGGFRLRSGEPYGFPRNLLAIIGLGSPLVELSGEGAIVDGTFHSWRAFNTVYLSGGPDEPEVIELIGDDPVTVLRTEAVPDGPKWTTASLREFASRIASLAGLPLYDELAPDQAWIDQAVSSFFAMIEKNIDRYPQLHAGQLPADTRSDLDSIQIQLEPDERYRASSLDLRIGSRKLWRGRRSLDLAEIDACRVTYRTISVRSAERGFRVKINNRVVAGPPEWYEAHQATLWALSGTARQAIGHVVVGGDGVSSDQVNWTAARILAAAAQAKTRDGLGDVNDVPEALRDLRDAD